MYLAFKWLIFLGLIMWALLCSFDTILDKNRCEGSACSNPSTPVNKNKLAKQNNYFGNSQRQSVTLLNYITFVAGALVVILYNKKSEIIQCAHQNLTKLSKIHFRANTKKVILHSKKTAINSTVAILKKIRPCWENLKNIITSIYISFINKHDNGESRKDRNLLLLKRLREVGQERNKLARFLVIAVEENKRIKLRYQLEHLSKNRLLQQIQETQDQVKEHRSKYVNFQQLHLVTHQENLYLKNRINKIARDKEETEANLMRLINRISQSTDNNLKAYCNCFVVKTRENLLSNSTHADISELLRKCTRPTSPTTKQNCIAKKSSNNDYEDINILPGTSTNKAEETKFVVPFMESKPKVHGFPGEYVWTIKDKDGIIEKLYEYDYGYNYDNGDMIRRIREYSVYHDSDCLLDVDGSTSSTTRIIRDTSPKASTLNMPNRKFLTGSPVFQQFLRSNSLAVSKQPAPPLLCA